MNSPFSRTPLRMHFPQTARHETQAEEYVVNGDWNRAAEEYMMAANCAPDPQWRMDLLRRNKHAHLAASYCLDNGHAAATFFGISGDQVVGFTVIRLADQKPMTTPALPDLWAAGQISGRMNEQVAGQVGYLTRVMNQPYLARHLVGLPVVPIEWHKLSVINSPEIAYLENGWRAIVYDGAPMDVVTELVFQHESKDVTKAPACYITATLAKSQMIQAFISYWRKYPPL